MSPRSPLPWIAVALLLVGGVAWHAVRRGSAPTVDTQSGRVPDATRADSDRPGIDAADPSQESPMSNANAAPRRTDDRTDLPHRAVTRPATEALSAPTPTVAIETAASLAEAMRQGDDRAPPIERSRDETPAPTPGELADPAAYLRYQSRQQARVYASFEQHALIALGDMQRDLQRARAEHLPPELIAEGDEKMRKLAETLARLQQGDAQAPAP